jgi:hypothetical protein
MGWKSAGKGAKSTETPPLPGKNPTMNWQKAELAKGFANLWRRGILKKKAHGVRGQEIKWVIPVDK